MTSTYQTTPLQLGANVYGSDGEKIGEIAEVQSNYFIIEKGFIFTTDMYLPTSMVTSTDEDAVHLSMTKAEIEDGDWSNPPALADQDAAGPVGYAGQHTDAEVATNRDRDVLERREERLVVDKDTERAGSVHVGKHVVEDEQSVDVPVTREDVTFERRAVDRPATGADLSDESIEVPVYEERVEAGKEARVVEELEVGKTARTGTERVTGTVRREEFDIDDDTTRP
ncbi:MAG: DUF2382 domain-containing protein [Chloroflexota bacterium]|nr:DUF2382 domain-containing protein [Chloroflexota bacterium]